MHAQKMKGALDESAAVGSGELSRHHIWDWKHKGDPGRELELEYTDRRQRLRKIFGKG
jgi:hypothetical protein